MNTRKRPMVARDFAPRHFILGGALCLFALAILTGLVPYEVLGLLPIVFLGEAGAAAVVGDITQTSTPADNLVRDVSSRLTEKEPHRQPLWAAMRRLRKGPRGTNEKVEWMEDDIIPRKTTTTAVTVAGAAGATKTLPLTDGGIYLVDDVIRLPNNVTTAGALIQVTGINGNDVDFVRADGGSASAWGTVPALASGELLVRIGNSKKEFFANSASRTTMPVLFFNYFERADVTIGISNTRAATKNYTRDDWQRSRSRQLYDFLASEEYRLFHGTRQKKTIGGDNRTFMGGIDFYQSTNELTYSAATFTEVTLHAWARQLFAGNKGSRTRYLHGDSTLMMDIGNISLDKVRRTQMESRTLKIGVTRLEFAGLGNIVLIHEQMFDEGGETRYGFILDYENLEIRDLNPMKAVPLNLEATQGLDGKAYQLKSEMSLVYRYDETHARVTGTA